MKKVRNKPDHAHKLLEEYSDVFADIFNVLLFDGEKVVEEDFLIAGPTEARYKAMKGNVTAGYRDILKQDQRDGAVLSLLGIENQTRICEIMAFRVVKYDIAAMEWKIRIQQSKNAAAGMQDFGQGLEPGQKVPPVFSIVLYFGTDEIWQAPLSIQDLTSVPEPYQKWRKSALQTSNINLIQVAFLDEETINKFSSDFRLVAQWFVAKRLGKEDELRYNKTTIQHVEAMMDFFATFTGDKRFKAIEADILEIGKESVIKMCTVVDKFINEGMEQGIARGLEQGRTQTLQNLIKRKLLKGKSIEVIAEELETTTDEIKSLLG